MINLIKISKSAFLLSFVSLFISNALMGQPVIDPSLFVEEWNDDFTDLDNWYKRKDCCYHCSFDKCPWKFYHEMVELDNGSVLLKTEGLDVPFNECHELLPYGCQDDDPTEEDYYDPSDPDDLIYVKSGALESRLRFPEEALGAEFNGEWLLYEVEAKFPVGNNDFDNNKMWSSLWLVGNNTAGDYAEIDIIEYYHSHFTMNTFGAGGDTPSSIVEDGCSSVFSVVPSEFNGAFNTFSVLWNNDRDKDDRCYFFVNNVFVAEGNSTPDDAQMWLKMDNKAQNEYEGETDWVDGVLSVNRFTISSLTDDSYITTLRNYINNAECPQSCHGTSNDLMPGEYANYTDSWLVYDANSISYNSQVEKCSDHVKLYNLNFDIRNIKDQITARTINRWGSDHPADVLVDEVNRTITVNFPNTYFIREVKIYIELEFECGPSQVLEITIDMPVCDECCPEGFEYGGGYCHSGLFFPGGPTWTVSDDGTFVVEPDFSLYPNNNGCPRGFVNNGLGCVSWVTIPLGFEPTIWSILGNPLITNVNCEKDCCPDNYTYDGANCYSGVHFQEGLEIYTIPGVQSYMTTPLENGECPPGFASSGVNCFYTGLYIPFGYEGFGSGNAFYVEPNCNTCCGIGYEFDGIGCNSGVSVPEGTIGNTSGQTFTTTLLPNGECPPGFEPTGTGTDCFYTGLYIPTDSEGFVHDGTFYTTPMDCFEFHDYDYGPDNNEQKNYPVHPENKIETIPENAIRVYPNPTSNSFNIDLSDVEEDVKEMMLMSSGGKLEYKFDKLNINPITVFEGNLKGGIYYLVVKLESDTKVIKVVTLP